MGEVNDTIVQGFSDGSDSCAYCGKRIRRAVAILLVPFPDMSDWWAYHPDCYNTMEDMFAVSAAVHTLLE